MAGMTEIADPRSHECDRPGLLRPARTEPVDVLMCDGGGDGDGSAHLYHVGELVTQDAPFAPTPGVEQIAFANDCDAAGGYRFICGND